jgi:hypothetical protein
MASAETDAAAPRPESEVTAPANGTTRPRRSWGRSVLSTVLGVLAVIGLLATILGSWARSSIYDTDTVAAAVNSALQDPAVIDALATRLTDQVIEAASVEDRIRDRLPDSQADLAPAFTGGVRAAVHEGFVNILSRDGTRKVVVGAARESHAQVVRIIETGELSTRLNTSNGTATLNLLPLMGSGFDMIQDNGILRSVEFPELERGGDPKAQIASLEEALGRPLPEDFGQIVVYRGDAIDRANSLVARAQEALELFRRAMVVLVVVTAVAASLSVVVANRRYRAIGFLAFGVVVAMAGARAIVRYVVGASPDLVTNPGARAAVARAVTSLAEGLLTAVTVALLVALAAAVIALLADRQGSLVDAMRCQREMVTAGAAGLILAVLWMVGLTPWGLAVTGALAAAVIAAAWLPAGSRSA